MGARHYETYLRRSVTRRVLPYDDSGRRFIVRHTLDCGHVEDRAWRKASNCRSRSVMCSTCRKQDTPRLVRRTG